MKHNFMTKMVSALLAVVLSTAAFSITAFASGGEESTESVAEQETAGDVSDLLSALAGSQVTVYRRWSISMFPCSFLLPEFRTRLRRQRLQEALSTQVKEAV